MPFTLCHPALAIPLHRRSGLTSLAALVIGSMAPDFVYFVPIGTHGGFTHSLPGILLYCVPAGMLVLALYYAVLRQPLLAWLPARLGARVEWNVPWPSSLRAVLIAAASLVIGALSHIVWDAFTHRHTPVVDQVAQLRMPIPIGPWQLPLYNLLQHLSSLAGLIVIVAYARAWYQRSAPKADERPLMGSRERLAVALWVLAATLGGAAGGALLRRAFSLEHLLFNITVTGMAAGALAILAWCVGWQLRRRSRYTRS